jgi:hypothetical protein
MHHPHPLTSPDGRHQVGLSLLSLSLSIEESACSLAHEQNNSHHFLLLYHWPGRGTDPFHNYMGILLPFAPDRPGLASLHMLAATATAIIGLFLFKSTALRTLATTVAACNLHHVCIAVAFASFLQYLHIRFLLPKKFTSLRTVPLCFAWPLPLH